MDKPEQLSCEVNAESLDKALADIEHILLSQRLGFQQRWYQGAIYMRYRFTLRKVALWLCGLGILLSALLIGLVFILNMQRWEYMIFLPIFCLLAVIFYYLPKCDNWLKAWSASNARKGSRKLAVRCVRSARQALPFTAIYRLENDSIHYWRKQGDVEKKIWSRPLKGIVYICSNAAIFFRKETSMQAKIIVLHDDAMQLAGLLNDHGLGYILDDTVAVQDQVYT